LPASLSPNVVAAIDFSVDAIRAEQNVTTFADTFFGSPKANFRLPASGQEHSFDQVRLAPIDLVKCLVARKEVPVSARRGVPSASGRHSFAYCGSSLASFLKLCAALPGGTPLRLRVDRGAEIGRAAGFSSVREQPLQILLLLARGDVRVCLGSRLGHVAVYLLD
jgi:hypothetical protein